MSKLTDGQKEIIRKAVELYQKYSESDEQKIRYEKLEFELNKFKDKLKSWDINDEINFIVDFALSDAARIFAADGMGKIAAPGFKTFMDMQEIRKNFKQLINYKFNIDDNTEKCRNVFGCDIRKILETNDYEFDRPKLLTGRLLLMIFTELFTTIADEAALNDVCKKLDIAVKDRNGEVRYLSKHRQIRCKIDDYLKESNLYDGIDELGRASIAWSITEV